VISEFNRLQVVFSEGLPWPDAETELHYSSARKFFLVGALKSLAYEPAHEPRCVEMVYLNGRLVHPAFRQAPDVGAKCLHGLTTLSHRSPWELVLCLLLWSGKAADANANLVSLRRKLLRKLGSSALSTATWAQLEAAVLTREAELALWQHSLAGTENRHAAYTEATFILSSALQVCLNARSVSSYVCGDGHGSLSRPNGRTSLPIPCHSEMFDMSVAWHIGTCSQPSNALNFEGYRRLTEQSAPTSTHAFFPAEWSNAPLPGAV